MEGFTRFFERFQRITGHSFYDLPAAARRSDGEFDPAGDPLLLDVAQRRAEYLAKMDDDFNTGGAIGDLFELLRALNKYCDDEKLDNTASAKPEAIAALKQGARVLRELAGTLGLFRAAPQASTGDDDGLVGKLMELMIKYRAEARKNRDWAQSDALRGELARLGWLAEDTPQGQQLRRA